MNPPPARWRIAMTLISSGPHHQLLRQSRYQATAGEGNDKPSENPAGGRISKAIATTPPDMIGLGMKLFLASLTMIFGATFVAYGIFRWRERAEWDSIVETPELLGLAGTTILLVIADIASMRALKKVESRAEAWRLTMVTLVFALIYMVVQGIAWVPLLEQVGERVNGGIVGGTLTHAGGLFLMLTFAHAVHVLGGIISNIVVLVRSTKGRGPARDSLRMLCGYWRFLTVMWVGVLVLLTI